jgi:hypothetical protein
MPSGSVGGAAAVPFPIYRYDVSKWGAVAGDTTGLLDIGLEAIRADIISTRAGLTGNTGGCEIYFPSSDLPWKLRFPFCVDLDNVVLRGAGREATTITTSNGVFPPFFLGLSRVAASGGGPSTILAANWPDLYQKLETSAASATGKRYGLRFPFNGGVCDTHATFPLGSSFSIGAQDHYQTMQKMTLDLCMDGYGSVLKAGPICGMADGHGVSPWYLRISGNNTGSNLLEFRLATSDCTVNLNQYYMVTVPIDSSWTQIVRISVQVDLTQALPVSIWASNTAYGGGTATVRVKQTVSAITAVGSPPAYSSGKTFAQNEQYPFQLGIMSMYSNAGTDVFAATDMSIYGLLLENGLLYDNTGGTGSPQARIDTLGATDVRTYFTARTTTIGYIDSSLNSTSANLDPRLRTNYPTTNPATAPYRMQGRLIPYQHGAASGASSYGYGLFIGNKSQGGGSNSMISSTSVRDMTVQMLADVDCAIAVGADLQPVLRNVRAVGGWHGIGSLQMGVQWTTWIDDCECYGRDAHIFASQSQIVITNFRSFSIAKEANFRFTGCAAIIDAMFLQGNATGKYAIVQHSPSGPTSLNVKHLRHDNEGGPFPTTALIRAENGGGGFVTQITLEDIGLGTIAAGGSIILLDTTPRPNVVFATMKVDINGLNCSDGQELAVVQIMGDGTLVEGEIRNVSMYDDQPVIYCNTTQGTSGFQSTHRQYGGPPTTNYWNAGSHRILPPAPTEGQFTEIRCLTSGQYGTATPPVWIGLGAIDYDGGSGLAAYVLPTHYITPPVLS